MMIFIFVVLRFSNVVSSEPTESELIYIGYADSLHFNGDIVFCFIENTEGCQRNIPKIPTIHCFRRKKGGL